MRREVSAAAKRGLQRGDVVRLGRFLLDLVVIDHGTIAGHDLGDGVGEVFAGSTVRLDDGAMRVRADYDQRACVIGLAFRGIVKDFYGLCLNLAARNFYEMDSVEEGRVQRRERVFGRMLTEMLSCCFGNRHANGVPHLPVRARDGGDVGEAPFLVARGGESQLGKALKCAIA